MRFRAGEGGLLNEAHRPKKITEVGGRRRINMAQGLDIRKDRISNRRIEILFVP